VKGKNKKRGGCGNSNPWRKKRVGNCLSLSFEEGKEAKEKKRGGGDNIGGVWWGKGEKIRKVCV